MLETSPLAREEPMMSRRWIVITAIALFITPGCAPYTQREIDLADQAKKGLALIRAAQADHLALTGRLTELQRRRLDEAFDADVREARELSPDWVIEHGRAYAGGLDALNTQRSASTAAAHTAARNIDAIEAAIESLQRLQRARLQLESQLNPKQEDSK
jgi:hypothetical protein